MFKQIIQKNCASVFCFCWLAISLLLPHPVFALEREEYAVKAAFVLNFAKMTTWPDWAFIDSPETLDTCLVGSESLVEAFRSIDGLQVGEHALRVRSISAAIDSRGCEILFVGNGVSRPALLRFFTAVQDRPVLIIGETADFAAIGGVINFILQKGKLHFEINPQEAQRKGLRISSRILQLATIVQGD